MKKIAVVILNFKVKKDTLACVKSVQKSNYSNLEIIVVDNNSQDGLEEKINEIEGVRFVKNKDNLGYTGGNNIGISKSE